MALEKDLNVPPYFDDYDPEKNYYRVLYRPTVPVQARELTQQQTILQTQIERFGNHIFKDGSVVDGVGIIYYPNVHFIAVDDFFSHANGSIADIYPTNLTANSEEIYLITNSEDSNNAVRATIKIAKDGVKENANNTFRETNRFYLDYTFTGTDLDGNDVNKISPGDTLYIYNSNQNKFGTLDANNLVYTINALSSNSVFTGDGYAYLIGCTDGTIYQKGFFSLVNKQTITVRDFSTNVDSYVVGFDTVETLIDENSDSTLLDNALGYPNENAPGAHRLKLTPTLVSKLSTDVSNNINFFAIVEFNGQQPTQQLDDPQYNEIINQFARRTYEESGDYHIKPFNIESIPNESNTFNFNYEISSGITYARGHRIEKVGTTTITTSKAIDTEVVENQTITANYGNYVICDEFLGSFDFNMLSEISLYDEPQRALSDYEGVSTTPSGSEVGKANVRAVVYESGEKGTSTARFYLYIFNIRMNSGKSFTNDVKSVYANGTYGRVKADLILENGLAILKEIGKNTLVFDTGIDYIRRLTDNTGINDTLYTYNQISTATLTNTSGLIVVTLNTAAPGATSERLLSTSGSVLSGSSLNEYNFYLSNTAVTANLTGNVTFTATSTTLTGTGTTFSNLEENSLIRIYANTTQTYVRKIITISNNTSLEIDLPVPQANTTNTTIQRYFVSGTPIPVNSITINSNTSFTVNTNLTFVSNSQSVYCTYPVYRNQTNPISKNINKNRFVTINCASHPATFVGPWNLGISDVHKIRNVHVGTNYSNSNPNKFDSWFYLDSGQTKEKYDHAKLYIKPAYASQLNTNSRLLIELDHFTANSSSSVGFFSVDSYPIDDVNLANTNAIQTIDLPKFEGNDIRRLVDFRPVIYNSAASSTTIAGATENPVSNTLYNVSASGQYIIAPDTNFIADIQYYLPRFDLILLDKDGRFSVKNGISSTNPAIPLYENDQSKIAEVFVPAYPTATTRDFEVYKSNEKVTVQLKTNKRYTMADIGALENRIKRIEYYTVLNALEQQAQSLTIPDTNGLDRFKNGIFADPFNSHNNGNVADQEYRISIDFENTIARPIFRKHDIDFQFNTSNSTNVQVTGPLVTLPYNDQAYIRQRYATKIRNCCESVWQWNGKLTLYPSYHFNRNETTIPNTNVDLDLASPWEQFAQEWPQSRFGDWRTISGSDDWRFTGQYGNMGIGSAAIDSLWVREATRERTVEQLAVNVGTKNIDLGNYVKDISIQPYMASRLVAFVAFNMKPNTTLHAFFDDVNVDQYCAPGKLDTSVTQPAVSLEHNVVERTGDFGAPLVSDSTGFVCGIFRIPDNTFRTGDRTFQLTNVDDLVVGENAKITVGKTVFTADNISLTRSSTTITVRQPELSTIQITETQNIQEFEWREDPIAQSFFITDIPAEVTGTFITKIGVYFRSKDPTLGCTLFICGMENNMPDDTQILGKKHLNSSEILVSIDGSVETQFTLEYPVYLLSNEQYAFIVQPDGNSPEYTIWIGETGGFDVATNQQVYANPASGVMFVSANRKTWTVIQKEDIKYNIYRANFTQTQGTAIFNNENDEYLTITGFTRPNTQLSVSVGDLVYTVDSSANTANVANLVSFTLISNTTNMYPVGYVQYFNEASGELWLDSSLYGGFSNTTNPTIAVYRPSNTSVSSINTTSLVAYTNVISVNNLKYHAIAPAFGTLEPSKTSLYFNTKGVRTTNAPDTDYTKVRNIIEYEFQDYERHAMSKSNEVSSLSSAKSSNFKIDLTTASSFVSPVINLSKKTNLYIENLINNDVTDEHTRFGNTVTKYISKRIRLMDGQEAEDIKIYLTANRPNGTDIKIYTKFWNGQDPELFDDKVWTLMQYDNGGEFVYSPTSSNSYIEYEFSVPSVNSVNYAAYANTGVDTYNPLGGGVSITKDSTTINAKEFTFNANTDIGNSNDTIAIASANVYFDVGDKVFYANAVGNTANFGLIANTIYYISFANASHIALSTSRTGANINLTANTTSETGHIITGTFFLEDFDVGDRIRVESADYFAIRTITSIANNTTLTIDKGIEQTNTASIYYVFSQTPGDGVVEYYNTSNSRFVGFKEFAIKIVLLSENPVFVPKLQDVRAIALQV